MSAWRATTRFTRERHYMVLTMSMEMIMYLRQNVLFAGG